MAEPFRDMTTRKTALAVFHARSDLILFDTETTGLTGDDVIVEIGAIRVNFNDDGSLKEIDRLHEYIRPPFAMPSKAVEINGITDEFLEDKPTIDEVFPKIESFFGRLPVAAYNSSFDVRFMRRMFDGQGGCFDPHAEIDVMKMAKDFVPAAELKRSGCKLRTICELLGTDAGIRFHGAMDDTIAMKRVADIIFRSYVDKERAAISRGRIHLVRPKVSSVSYWNGPNHKLQRVYIRTSIGQFFFDQYYGTWNPDTRTNNIDLDTVDMEWLQAETLRLTNAESDEALSKWKGVVVA